MAFGMRITTQRAFAVSLALVPMLLGPFWVQFHCCCADFQRLALQLEVSRALVECHEPLAGCESPATAACPFCQDSGRATVGDHAVAAFPAVDGNPESLSRSCDCRVELLAPALLARVELLRSDEIASPLLPCLSDGLHSLVGTSPSHLRKPTDERLQTSHQRCALLCCWLK